MRYLPSQLVKVLSGEWSDALGLVTKTDPEGVWVRLGNGVMITEHEDNLEPVEYAPGTGCPATFPEEFKGGWMFERAPGAGRHRGDFT
jgi:hypothetical protein